MRLLVVSQYFWPENFRVNDLVGELVQRGHQVTVLTGLPNYPEGDVFPEFRHDPDHFAEYQGAEIIRVPMLPRGKGSYQLLLNYFSFAFSAIVIGLWKLRDYKFDVIFACQLSPVTVGLPAVVMRFVKRAPLVFWVLDLWPDSLQAIGAVRSRTILYAVGKLVSFIYKRCDVILVQSKSFIPLVKKHRGIKAPVYYFPSWAEAIFNMSAASPAEEVPCRPGAFTVLFAGNIGEAQDFPMILAAAKHLKEQAHIRWLIVGDGRMARWMADEIVRLHLQECVLMLGRYPVERMPSFFKHASALLVSLKDKPIFSMTVPGKLQSYLAAGVPVIAMLNGEGADLVNGSNSGLTCPAGDYLGLSAAVLAMSRLTMAEMAAMGQNGLVVSAQEFDRDKLITQLEEWLLQLLSQADFS